MRAPRDKSLTTLGLLALAATLVLLAVPALTLAESAAHAGQAAAGTAGSHAGDVRGAPAEDGAEAEPHRGAAGLRQAAVPGHEDQGRADSPGAASAAHPAEGRARRPEPRRRHRGPGGHPDAPEPRAAEAGDASLPPADRSVAHPGPAGEVQADASRTSRLRAPPGRRRQTRPSSAPAPSPQSHPPLPSRGRKPGGGGTPASLLSAACTAPRPAPTRCGRPSRAGRTRALRRGRIG